jgi:hypothetical protein
MRIVIGHPFHRLLSFFVSFVFLVASFSSRRRIATRNAKDTKKCVRKAKSHCGDGRSQPQDDAPIDVFATAIVGLRYKIKHGSEIVARSPTISVGGVVRFVDCRGQIFRFFA